MKSECMDRRMPIVIHYTYILLKCFEESPGTIFEFSSLMLWKHTFSHFLITVDLLPEIRHYCYQRCPKVVLQLFHILKRAENNLYYRMFPLMFTVSIPGISGTRHSILLLSRRLRLYCWRSAEHRYRLHSKYLLTCWNTTTLLEIQSYNKTFCWSYISWKSHASV